MARAGGRGMGGRGGSVGPCKSLKASNEVLEFQTLRNEKAGF